MKIGIVTTWFERGAAYVSKQYENILKENHNIYIYARGGEKYAQGDPVWDNANVHWGKKSGLPIVTGIDLPDFQNWLEKNDIEIVFFNEQWWWKPVLLCKKLNIITGAYIDYYTEETVPLFANYDFLICNTKRHFSVFNWHRQCFYVPWGTDTNVYTMNLRNNNNNELVFFHSAGMNPHRKGTDFTLLAFNALSKKYKNVKLLIHTQKDLGAYFPELDETIALLIEAGKLELINKSISAPGLYSEGDIYIYPSRLDGIGLTLMEAMSCGLPVITSNNAPMNEFINTDTCKTIAVKKLYCRKDGYYWPMCEVNVVDLEEQMEWYVLNISKMNELKLETRKFSEEHLDWMANQKTLDDIFLKVQFLPLDQKSMDIAYRYDQNKNHPYIMMYHKYKYTIIKYLKKVLMK